MGFHSESYMPDSNRIASLDGIRGLSILAVLIGHGICPIQLDAKWMTYAKFIASMGTYGVDLFFVLSGFLISKILYSNHGSENLLKTFWIRRIARIMPLYFAFIIILYLVCTVFMPRNMPQIPLWAYFLYVQNFFLASGYQANHFGFDITWSLVVEEHFYLIFPLLIAFAKKKYHFFIVATICCLGLPFRHLLHPWMESECGLANLNFLSITGRLDELGLGALLAIFFYGNRGMPEKLFSPSVSMLAWLIVFSAAALKSVDNIMPAIASLLLIGSVIFGKAVWWLNIFESKPLRFLGRISYALYLFHTPMFWFAHDRTSGYESFIAVGIATVFAIFAAWLSTKYFEEPIQSLAKKYRY
jgi:peptidoglycan/LPS O-acetylase OafA/YrhL